MTGPGKEHGTNKPPPTRRVQKRSKGDTTCPITSQNPSLWNPSWLNKVCTTRKDSESEWLAKDNPETNPITIKPKTSSHMAELFSWVPLPYCSTLWCPFPIKSLALSAHVSPWTIHFWVLDKSPVSALEGVHLPQFSSVAESCLTLCDPVNCSTPSLPVHHQLPEFTQTHVHRVSDAIQPSNPLSSPSPPAPNPSQHQSFFQWVNSSHEVAKVLEFQL